MPQWRNERNNDYNINPSLTRYFILNRRVYLWVYGVRLVFQRRSALYFDRLTSIVNIVYRFGGMEIRLYSDNGRRALFEWYNRNVQSDGKNHQVLGCTKSTIYRKDEQNGTAEITFIEQHSWWSITQTRIRQYTATTDRHLDLAVNNNNTLNNIHIYKLHYIGQYFVRLSPLSDLALFIRLQFWDPAFWRGVCLHT